MKKHFRPKQIMLLVLWVLSGLGLLIWAWAADAQQRPDKAQPAAESSLDANERMRQMPHYSTALGRPLTDASETAVWTELGPGNLGGRTRALVINPANPNIIYVASPGGGVWKTVNGGAVWAPLNDLLPHLVVTTLALDPKNPEVIYAGTGESIYARSNRRGAGIFKSSDSGASWAQLAGTKTKDFAYINDLVISPINNQRLYAATGNGVWRSLDGGVNWTPVLKDQIIESPCADLALRTDQQGDYLFASYRSAIYRNPEAAGAGSWTQVYTEFGLRGATLALAPSNQNIVYALVEGGSVGGQLGLVLRSTSSGEAGTWTVQVRGDGVAGLGSYLLSDMSNIFGCQRASNLSGAAIHRGWYARSLAIDPLDPQRLWVGGVDLFRSDDGGVNWGAASYWWADKRAPQYAPADQHAIVFHPQYNGATNQTLLVANDGGIYRTNNARAAVATSRTAPCNPAESSVVWAALNNGYNITQFNHGAVATDGRAYLGGTVASGVVRGTEAGGLTGWQQVLSSNVGFNDGGYVAIAGANAEVLYATLVDARAAVWKSTDGGRSFASVVNGVVEPGSSPGYFARLTIDPSDPLRLWLGSYSLFRTANGAARWARAAGPTGAPFITVSPADSNSVLTADYRSLYVTSNGLAEQANWRAANPRYSSVTNAANPIAGAAVDPVDKRIFYLVYGIPGGQHVWKTIDAGATWQALDGVGATALPDVPVHSIAVDPNNPARIYVGTEAGVFVTLDGGVNWAVETTGFGRVAVKTLVFVTAGGATSLFAFTDGRGAWRVTTSSSGCQRTLSATRTSFGAAGGNTTVNVAAGCAWTVESNAAWITAIGGGAGAGTARLAAAANTSFAPRVGTATIAGRSFTIYQAAAIDATPPTLTIVFPTANPFTLRSANLSLAARISDDNGAVTVTWSNDRFGGVSTETRNSPLSTLFFRLQPGLNQLTIKARDTAGNETTATRSVIFKPEYIISTLAGTGVAGFSGDGGPAAAAQINIPVGLSTDRVGNLYFADARNYRLRKITPTGVISTVAGIGVLAQTRSGDGQLATLTPLQSLRNMTATGNGDLYFLEGFTALRRIAAETGLLNTIATIAIQSADVAVDEQGNALVTGDNANQIYKVTPQGAITRFAGTGQFSGPLGDGGPAAQATLFRPHGITVDRNSNAIFADAFNHRVRQIAPNAIITTLVGDETFSGSYGDGGPARGVILYPNVVDVATDQAGNLFIAENSRVRKVTSDGIINTIAGTDSIFYNGDGQLATAAAVGELSSMAVDNAGHVYLADGRFHRIRKLTPLPANDASPPTLALTSPTANPVWTALSGRLYLAGTAADNTLVAQVMWRNDRGGSGTAFGGAPTWNAVAPLQPGLNRLTVTAWDAAGNAASITLAVTYNAAAEFETAAGKPVLVPASSIAPPAIQGGFSGDSGPAAQAQLHSPRAVARDAAGNLYIADTLNHRIRKVAPDGRISTYAGGEEVGATGDGGPATAATLNEPHGLAVDALGDLYIADTLNNRIRKVTPAGSISTVAGTGADGLSGDGGLATLAQLSGPQGLAVDNIGNLYIADTGNHRVRKLTVSTGLITTIAGSGSGFGGDGGAATAALLRTPGSVAVDQAGNLYLADTGNLRLRKVTPAGIITTIAGNGLSGSTGDGGLATAARLTTVNGLAVDAAGNVYLSDTNSHRLRRISPAGVISLLAGVGGNSFTTFGSEAGDALTAQLHGPTSLALDAAGKLYVADTGNHRVLAVTVLRQPPALASVSAASYAGVVAARASINAAFGANLASQTAAATTTPLATELAGVSLRVRDGAGVEWRAPLFFVSPGQLNFQMPPDAAPGPATLVLANNNGELAVGAVFITNVAPGLFSANANGQGAAGGVALRVKPGGVQSYEPLVEFDPALRRYVARPLDLGSESEQVFLVLFGTGLRGYSSPSRVTVKVGGVDAPLQYLGAQGGLVGLDQLNLRLPRTLAGRGEVEIALLVDGSPANLVHVNIK